ncbi:MAG: DUF1902 domain-containing protein [Pelolinea sp.]|nr:DUF1902 domain-containing protein [Pelolinea sp.]
MKNYFPLTIELDREEDGRWIADISDLPGVMVYGNTTDDAIEKIKDLANKVIQEQQELGERPKDLLISFVIA